MIIGGHIQNKEETKSDKKDGTKFTSLVIYIKGLMCESAQQCQ